MIESQDLQWLRRVYLFDSLTDGQFERVMRTSTLVRLAPKQALFAFSQPAERFYLLKSGQLKLFRLSADGDEKVVEIVQPGKTFAEAVMFMERHVYPVNAQAIEVSEVYSFDMAVFLELLQDSRQACFRLMASMSQRLHGLVEEITNLALQNATYRLVNYLLQQLPDGAVEAPDIHLETPKSVIAARISVQPETLSRTLARLSARGLLEVHGSHITIRDINGLRSLL